MGWEEEGGSLVIWRQRERKVGDRWMVGKVGGWLVGGALLGRAGEGQR